MRKLALLAIAMSVLVSCQRTPSAADLASKYTTAPDAFEKLSQMIKVDAGERKYFVVGFDAIGEYRKDRGEWTHYNDYKIQLSLTEALKAMGLSEERYREYKQLFASTGSEQVSFNRTENNPPQVSVLVDRSGLVTYGCSGSINWRKVPPTPTEKHSEGNFFEITLLNNGWYLERECN